MPVLTSVAPLDDVLQRYAPAIGNDFTGYRNHAYRVMNFCAVLSGGTGGAGGALSKIAFAAAFHDLGIWTDRTFDYLEPSARHAAAYLEHEGKADWVPEVRTMIHEHHKITRYRGDPGSLVEAFRRADLVDVSRGIFTFGLPRRLVREVFATFPNAGFHRRLLQLAFARARRHPLSPLPMLRL